MTHRSKYRIVYDMLKELAKVDMPMKLGTLFFRAKLRRQHQQETYTNLLIDNNLALISSPDDWIYLDTAVITQKGLQYIQIYKQILSLMKEK